MHGWLDLPEKDEMEFEAATFNAWTRKRYIKQGKKHSYCIYDFISVSPWFPDHSAKQEQKD